MILFNRARFVSDRCPNIMTFQGTWINNEYIAFFDMLDNDIPEEILVSALKRDFTRIKHIFACDTTRIVLRPYYPDEANNGFQFPYPAYNELEFLETFVNIVKECGMKLFPVFVLPDRAGYAWKDPYTHDTFYANNGKYLYSNYKLYVNTLLRLFQNTRCDVFGDFDPLDVYKTHSDLEKIHHQDWYELIRQNWPDHFVEVIGSVDRPLSCIEDEIKWLIQADASIPYSFQFYTDMTYKPDFYAIIKSAYRTGDGSIMIEETGSYEGDEITDDGDLGRKYYRQIFNARNAVDPYIPVGIWAWGSSTKNGWGWSMNKQNEIRRCWWPICEGSSGLMWDISSNKAIIHATRRQSNYLVIPFNNSSTVLSISTNWPNFAKFGAVYTGTAEEPIDRLNLYSDWLTPDQPFEVAGFSDSYIWISIDFNWVDPNLWVAVEVK